MMEENHVKTMNGTQYVVGSNNITELHMLNTLLDLSILWIQKRLQIILVTNTVNIGLHKMFEQFRRHRVQCLLHRIHMHTKLVKQPYIIC